MTVGDVEAERVVPFELSQPWPKDVCPVPPFDMPRVPVMSEVKLMSDVATEPAAALRNPERDAMEKLEV